MPEIAQSQERCAVCGCSRAWDFPGVGPRCPEHYGEAADPKIANLIAKQRVKNHPERDFQSRVIDLLHLHGFKVAHFRPAMDSKGRWHTAVQADGAGWPDIVAIEERHNSISRRPIGVAWELKAQGKKATPEQVEWLRLFELAGFYTRVWHEDEEDELIKLVESWR